MVHYDIVFKMLHPFAHYHKAIKYYLYIFLLYTIAFSLYTFRQYFGCFQGVQSPTSDKHEIVSDESDDEFSRLLVRAKLNFSVRATRPEPYCRLIINYIAPLNFWYLFLLIIV